MLQNFHLGVLKVDLGVAHIAMAIHACFKCFIYFICMLQMFHLDVAKVDLILHMLLMAIHVCFKPTFIVFHMFQTYVASVSFGCFKSRSRGSTYCNGAGERS
jgi:hypothetical protein